jgi:hypothetical protein
MPRACRRKAEGQKAQPIQPDETSISLLAPFSFGRDHLFVRFPDGCG